MQKDDGKGEAITLTAAMLFFQNIMAFVAVILDETPAVRNRSLLTQRMMWDDYILKFSSRPSFIKRHLRMTLESFYKPLGYIRTELEVDVSKAGKGGPILPELCLFCTLRWLAGGSYLDIFALTGVSISSFYRVCYRCLRLINKAPQLEIRLPQTEEECELAAEGFRSVNVRSFFSGHYQCYGINIQAICDHHSRFTFFHVASPGSVNPRRPFFRGKYTSFGLSNQKFGLSW
jgi:hypothetical protein